MLIKLDYEVFIILLLSLHLFLITPTSSFVVTAGLMWFIYALFLLLYDVDYLFYMLRI